MSVVRYEYSFAQSLEVEEIEAVLLRAVGATSALHGETEVRLNARHALNVVSLNCRIDAHGIVGQHLNKLFVAFLPQEFGPDSFRVERMAVEVSS